MEACTSNGMKLFSSTPGVDRVEFLFLIQGLIFQKRTNKTTKIAKEVLLAPKSIMFKQVWIYSYIVITFILVAHSQFIIFIKLLTVAPLGPGNPITPGCPRAPCGPGGPGRPSSPAAPWTSKVM